MNGNGNGSYALRITREVKDLKLLVTEATESGELAMTDVLRLIASALDLPEPPPFVLASLARQYTPAAAS